MQYHMYFTPIGIIVNLVTILNLIERMKKIIFRFSGKGSTYKRYENL